MEMKMPRYNFRERAQPKRRHEVRQEQFYAELTDPKQHDPRHFCYIVHGLNPSAKNGLLLLALEQEGYDASQEVDLLYEPERIAEKKLISTSIINQDYMKTWGSVFFILDIPWNNFVTLSPRDNATNITNPDFVLEQRHHPTILPSELIAQSEGMNEVVVTGTRDKEQVKIIGIGIKLTDVGENELREPTEAPQMRAIAEKLGVPLIEIVETVRIPDSAPKINFGSTKYIRSIYINQGGFRYCFEGDWEQGQVKDIFKSDKNFYGGHNPISKEEWLLLRPKILAQIDTPTKRKFLRQIDKRFSNGSS